VPGGKRKEPSPSVSLQTGWRGEERESWNQLFVAPGTKVELGTTSSSSAGGEREGESLPSGDYQESLEKREKTLLLRERLETKENQGTTTSGVEGPLKIYF
jgi:hypothetical protein